MNGDGNDPQRNTQAILLAAASQIDSPIRGAFGSTVATGAVSGHGAMQQRSRYLKVDGYAALSSA